MRAMNFSRFVDLQRLRRADKPALIGIEETWTFERFAHDVHATAYFLRAQGIKKGDRVAMFAMNSPEFVVVAQAIFRIGAINVPLNYRLQLEELQYLLRDSGATLIFCDAEFTPLLDQASAGMSIKARVQINEPDRLSPDWLPLRQIVSAGAGKDAPIEEVEFDHPQRIMYTSGTTSRPKGAIITHGMCALNALGQTSELELNASDRALISGPLYHVAAWDAPGMSVLFNGGSLVIMHKFDAPLALELIQNHKVTGGIFVQAILHNLRNAGAEGTHDLSSLKWIIFGAAAGELYREIREMLPNAHLVQAFGMTEACSAVSYMDRAHAVAKLGSAGSAVPYVEFKIVDPDDRDLPPGKDGELVLRGPKVTPGYWNDPERTADAMRNGWFHTGDVGHVDADGFLYITDRLKDMIRSGGENVASQEVERVLYQHPGISEVAVIGIPHPRWQEVPEAHVVLKPGAAPTAEELIAFCRSQLASFKTPKSIKFVDELPRNASGKVLKRVLRERSVQSLG